MPKYRIFWDSGYGESDEIIDVANEKTAIEEAYKQWMFEAETNADYGAELVEEEADGEDE